VQLKKITKVLDNNQGVYLLVGGNRRVTISIAEKKEDLAA